MNDKDAKELIKQLQRMNKNLEKLTEAVEKTNRNYIYAPEPIYKYEPIDPYNPYKITCDHTSSANPPYYGTKVDTDAYGVVGADWTCADSLEVTH